MKKMMTAAALAGVMALPMAATTQAQPQVVVGGGLVNVQVTDVLNNLVLDVDVAVGVAANIIANVCGLSVGVLATDLARGNTVNCDGFIEGAPVDVVAGR